MKKLAPIVPLAVLWLGYWGFYALLGGRRLYVVWWSAPYLITGIAAFAVSVWWATATVLESKD